MDPLHWEACRVTCPIGLSSLRFILAQDKDQSTKRNRFSEGQTIGLLKEHEAPAFRSLICAASTASVRPGIYKFEGRARWDERLRRQQLRTLEDDNTRLKRLLSDAMLDNA